MSRALAPGSRREGPEDLVDPGSQTRELDVKRRAGLMPLLERAHHAQGQVFMTCTEENWPREIGRDLKRWHVTAGALTPD